MRWVIISCIAATSILYARMYMQRKQYENEITAMKQKLDENNNLMNIVWDSLNKNDIRESFKTILIVLTQTDKKTEAKELYETWKRLLPELEIE